ncbi:MAG: hypothetical protein N2484_03125 [Clostridia bacterium]|nr:hypothetical protein [Clostridia bacterium]
MKQLIFKDKIYIWGKMPEVLAQLSELSRSYKTVKELLDSKTKYL